MDEVDRLTVDLGAELRQSVEPGLVRAPVVLVAPVGDELAHVVDGDAVVPSRVVELVREPGLRKSPAEIVEVGLVDVDPERLDGAVHGAGVKSRCRRVSPRRMYVGA